MLKPMVEKKLKGYRKGTYCSITFGKRLEMLNEYYGKVEKITSGVFRLGIDYSHIHSVKNSHISDFVESTEHKLPWGEWADDKGYFITHKGNDYLRIYPVLYNRKCNIKTEYYLNGEKISLEYAKKLCKKSEFSEKSDKEPTCFTIKVENIQSIR